MPTGAREPEAFPSSFATADGLQLFARATWPPGGRAVRAAAIVVHGLGDHSGSASGAAIYAHLGPLGIASFAYDQRGFGRSPGPRAFARSFAPLRDDLAAFVDRVRACVPGVPVFLVGLSLGGLQVLDLALARPRGIAGVVAAAPALGEPRVPRVLRVLAPLLSRVLPRLRMDPGLELDNLSKDPEAVRAYVEDPLFEIEVSARLGCEAMRAMRSVARAAPWFTLPLLLLHGEADRITSPAESRAFHATAASADKTLILYPDAVHDPLIDREREEVLRDLGDRIAARAPDRAAGSVLDVARSGV